MCVNSAKHLEKYLLSYVFCIGNLLGYIVPTFPSHGSQSKSNSTILKIFFEKAHVEHLKLYNFRIIKVGQP